MAKQIITDALGEREVREIFPAARIPDAALTQPDVSAKNDGFLGLGEAITGSSCYVLSKMEKSAREALLKSIYGKEGLNLSVARISIGASDYSAELYSYDDGEEDVSLERFSVERDRAYVLPILKEILKIKPDLFVFASPWSPPGWMKTGGSMCGGYMRDKYVDVYADYFVKFIKAYAEEGVRVSAVTPQNECETQQSGRMPACEWHPETEAKFILSLRKKLDENGLKVQIWAHDHNFSGTDRVLWYLDNVDGLASALSGVAFHYYDGNIEQTRQVRKKYPALKLHFTEGGPRLHDNYATDHVKWAKMLTMAIECGYSSMTGWNLALDECGKPTIGPFDCAGFVTVSGGEVSVSGQYKAFSHVSPYLRKDSAIYPLVCRDWQEDRMAYYPRRSEAPRGFVIKSPSAAPVVVLVNANDSRAQTQVELDGKLWYADLPAKSVSTLEF